MSLFLIPHFCYVGIFIPCYFVECSLLTVSRLLSPLRTSTKNNMRRWSTGTLPSLIRLIWSVLRNPTFSPAMWVNSSNNSLSWTREGLWDWPHYAHFWHHSVLRVLSCATKRPLSSPRATTAQSRTLWTSPTTAESLMTSARSATILCLCTFVLKTTTTLWPFWDELFHFSSPGEIQGEVH